MSVIISCYGILCIRRWKDHICLISAIVFFLFFNETWPLIIITYVFGICGQSNFPVSEFCARYVIIQKNSHRNNHLCPRKVY